MIINLGLIESIISLASIEQPNKILELLFNAMPYVFWKDKNGKYQGGNLNQAQNLGFLSPAEFIGKTIFEILKDQKSARLIDEIDNKVMRENITIISEEKMISSNGEKTYLSQKFPIHDDDGKVIGMLGFSMDVTELKQKEELLKQERDVLLKAVAERSKEEALLKLAFQVAHDIASPTVALSMLVDACDDIPEEARALLKQTTIRINDIAQNLLAQYQYNTVEEQQVELLLSDSIKEILAEKRLQYANLPISFDYVADVDSDSSVFIRIQVSSFKRMLSNIINNAVDAFDNKHGKIVLELRAGSELALVIIKDNGKGISQELIEKIMNNISVTEGKENGHGIGLTQVRETLQRNKGQMKIDSELNQGTRVTLSFPRV